METDVNSWLKFVMQTQTARFEKYLSLLIATIDSIASWMKQATALYNV